MDKREAINYLIELSKKQGEHNGRWENEYIQEESAMIYCDDMKEIADDIGIEYAKGDDFIEELEELEEDIDCFNAYDEWGFMLQQKLEKHLINVIMGE